MSMLQACLGLKIQKKNWTADTVIELVHQASSRSWTRVVPAAMGEEELMLNGVNEEEVKATADQIRRG
jgi:hypothetical protein